MTKTILLILLLTVLFSCSKVKTSDKASEKMQEFVINISKYAKEYDSNFIIIPQNGLLTIQTQMKV